MDMLKARPCDDDGQPATKGDVRRAYRRNLARFWILLTLFGVLGGSFAAYSHQQQADGRAVTYGQCVDRRHNVIRANAFYQNMANLEQSNRFIDARLRVQRVALYRGLVYTLPECGKP